MPSVCLEYPTRKCYRVSDEMPITEEHGHAGADLARPGFLMVCRGHVVKVPPKAQQSEATRAFLEA